MKTTINVTEDDIRFGIRHPAKCPVGRAVQRVVCTSDIAAVPDYIRIGGDYLDAPISVKDFIIRFDKNISSHPFTFELDIPKRYLKTETDPLENIKQLSSKLTDATIDAAIDLLNEEKMRREVTDGVYKYAGGSDVYVRIHGTWYVFRSNGRTEGLYSLDSDVRDKSLTKVMV